MFPLLTGLITGGASLLGSIFSSNTSASNTQANIAAQQQAQANTQAFNAEEAAKARDFNAGQAGENREFQADQAAVQRGYETQMSNSAYQRASADMKQAGLNPMMMFGSGSAASTPSVSAPSGSAASGPSASASTPNMALHNATSPLAGVGDAVGKAVNGAISAQTFDKMVEETANLRAQQAKIAAETLTERERPAKVRAETETERERPAKTREETLLTSNEAQLKSLAMPHARFSAKSAEDLLGIPDWLRQSLNVGAFSGKKVDDVLSPLVNSANSVFRNRFYFNH